LAVAASWLPLINVVSIVFAIIAIILGISAIRGTKLGKCGGKVIGIIGVILSLLASLFSVLVSYAFTFGIGNVIQKGYLPESERAAIVEVVDKLGLGDVLANLGLGDIVNNVSSSAVDGAADALDTIVSNVGGDDSNSNSSGNTSDNVNTVSWEGKSITINGVDVTLGKTTVGELETAGYTCDDETVAAGNHDYQMVTLAYKNKDTEDYLRVQVWNPSDDNDTPFKDCVIMEFMFDGDDQLGPVESEVSFNGITVGESTTDDVQKIMGDATSAFGGRSEYQTSDHNYVIEFNRAAFSDVVGTIWYRFVGDSFDQIV
jgi:hypothetical protein